MITTVDQIRAIVQEAEQAAADAAQAAFVRNGNTDWDACGFGWVSLYRYNGKKLDGRSKLARLLKEAGVSQNWERVFQIWNPGRYGGQSITIKEAAARAAADVFKRHGFDAYASSRLD